MKKSEDQEIQETSEENQNSISYHNKDIFSKFFGENLKDRSFAAYGLKLPKIIDVLPTNLPLIEANELRIDNLYRLEDRTLALVDYESTYSYEDKIKYLNYIARALKRNWMEGIIEQPIRMIVIYTGNVKRDQTKPSLDVDCLQFTVEEVFLSELDASVIENNLTTKINTGEQLNKEEEMQFILLPLIYGKREEQQNCIRRCFELAKKLTDEKQQVFLLAGILVFTDKVINKKDSGEIRRWLNMTKVGRIVMEEINQAVNEAVNKTSTDIASKMKKLGVPTSEIMKYIDGITEEEIKKLN